MRLAMLLSLSCLVTLACARSPQERQRRSLETMQREVDAAARAYATFATLKQGLGAATVECDAGVRLPTTFRLSMAHLELLNGAPHQDGVLAIDLPAPAGFDNLTGFPPRQLAPRELGDDALEREVKALQLANDALKDADGYLVQRIDAWVPPTRAREGIAPGSITGRLVAFDGAGQPICHLPYEATGSSDAGVDEARRALELDLRRVFRERCGYPAG